MKGAKLYAIGYDDLLGLRGIIPKLYETKQEALDVIELLKDDYDDEHWHYFTEEFVVV